MLRKLRALGLIALMVAASGVHAAHAADDQGGDALPLPRFASLKSNEVNLRAGPGQRYPIEWVYRRAGHPVEIVAQFDVWRQIKDSEGTLGWVHQSLLSGQRTALITGGVQSLRVEPSESASGVALAEPGVLVELKTCVDAWCEVSARGYTGWLRHDEIWGVYPNETLQ